MTTQVRDKKNSVEEQAVARTIDNLRDSLEGKIYIICHTEPTFRRFLADAEEEGYLIGNKKPTEAGVSWDIKAVEYDKKISNCGIISHIACQTGAAHRIDYERYCDGCDDFVLYF